jgi:hypothetical protein
VREYETNREKDAEILEKSCLRKWLIQPLIVPALFALIWAVFRACVQAVVIDEAETFDVFATRPTPTHWLPGSNNHVLNSLLIRFCALMLGPSHLSLRLPALVGALIYICAAFWIANMLSAKTSVRIPVFLCLVYNPLVFDFFPVGRGYSFALGGLLAAIAVSLWAERKRLLGENNSEIPVAISSALLGISFSANFSFAFVDVSGLGSLTIWAVWTATRKGRALVMAITPMVAVCGFFCSYTLWKWPAGDLRDGETTLAKTLAALAHSSLYELNPNIINPLLLPWLEKVQQVFLLPIIGALWLLSLVFCIVAFKRETWGGARWYLTVLCVALIPLIAALGLHTAAHLVAGILFPRNRMATYVIVLVTLFAGGLAAIPGESRSARRGSFLALSGVVGVGRILHVVDAAHLYRGMAISCGGKGRLLGAGLLEPEPLCS